MRGLISMLIVGLVIAAGAFCFIWMNADALIFSRPGQKTRHAPPEQRRKPERESATAQNSEAKKKRTVEVEGKVQFRITLPEQLRTVRFGMPPAALKKRFPPAWQRETRGLLTLVHYPDKSKKKQYRFEFTASGLAAVEVRYNAHNAEELSDLYKTLQRQACDKFGSHPGTPRTTWTNSHLTARLLKAENYVAMRFTPKQ